MSNVPTNLIPTKITGLPEYTGSSTLGYLPYVLEGRTYKVQFANIAAVGAVPSTREINTGSGLGGGGDLSANRTLYILPGGVDDSRLSVTGVTAGTYGAADTIPVFTVNAQGRVTAVTDTPIVLSGYVPISRTITAGNGLTGGGDLSANRSFAVNFSSTTPEPLGIGSSGVSNVAARGDHVHPAVDLSDTTETQGVLPLSRGGTGNSLSPVAGAIVYSSNDKLYLTTAGSVGQVLRSGGPGGVPFWTDVGAGTVTSVAVATANGFAGTVASPTLSPVITLSTTVTGMVKGNGTAVSAATAGVDYVEPGAYTASGLTMATARLLGRTTASVGAAQEISVGTGLTLATGSLVNAAPDQVVSLTAGTAISVTGTYPSFTVTNTAPDQVVSLTGAGTTTVTGTYPSFTITSNDSTSGTVTSVNASGGTTGMSFTGGPITSAGTLTLNGTLAVSNGGTGATDAVAALTNLGAYPASNPAGYTSNVGTVTSVSGTGTVSGLSLSGTVTSAGSLTLGGTLAVLPSNFASQTANTVLAAPNGSAGTPTFRAIVAADIPTLNQNTTGTASNVTGIVAVANGGTGASVAATARTNLGAAASGANTDITSIALTTGTISTSPVSGTDIVNKAYADSIASGINFHQSVRLATAAALPAYTYNNGTSGVGATITANANAALSVDGVAVVVGNRILVKNEVAQANNGVYTVTQTGSGAAPYILTRATDFDSSGSGVDQIDAGDFFLVTAGSTLSNTSWVQQTPLPITVGTTALVFTQFAAPVLYSAGTGLTLTGTTFSITNTGVSASTYGSASSVPVIAVNAQGQLTSASSSSIAIAASQITSGALAIANGGTGATSAATALTNLGAYPASNPAGYTSNVGTVTSVNLTAGTGVSVSGGPITASGSITVTNTAPDQVVSLTGAGATTVTGTYPNFTISSPTAGAGTVTSINVSGGTTGLTTSGGPVTSSGTITLAGTLNVANGGTGATTLSSGYVLKGNGTSAVSASVIYDNGTNVGVGTTSVSATYGKLTVAGGIRTTDDTSSKLELGRYSAGAPNSYIKLGTNSASLRFTNAGDTADLMTLTNAGNLGIGTTSVAGRLHSVSTTGFTDPTLLCGDGVSNFRVVFNTGAYAGVPANKPWLHSYDDIYLGSDATTAFNVMSGGVNTLRVTSGGSVTASGDFRAPIFYDSANTSYYLDPTGSTSLNTAGNLITSGNLTLNNGANRYVRIGSATNYSYDLQTTGDDFQIIEAGTTPRLTIKYPNGFVGIGTTSPLANVHVVGAAASTSVSPPAGTQILGHAGGFDAGSFGASLNFTQQWWSGAPTSLISVGQITGLKTAGNGNFGGGLAFFVGPSGGGSSTLLEAMRIDGNAGGAVTANVNMRSPLFYDSNDTAYFLDPNSTSVLNIARLSQIQFPSGTQAINFTDPSYLYLRSPDGGIRLYLGGSDPANYYDNTTHFFRTRGGSNMAYINSSGVYAPIFYDIDNTAYYINPNAGSNVLGDFRVNQNGASGIQLLSTTGTQSLWIRTGYSGAPTPSVSATNVQFQSSGSSAGTFNFWSGNTLSLSILGDYAEGAGSLRAPIFYDSNNTGYYVDPAGTSVLSVVRAATIQHSSGNTAIVLNGSTWTQFCDVNGATKLWLGGTGDPNNYYNANIHYFRNNGSGNTMTIDSAGTVIATADMRAPIFYDSSNTGYYLDPAANAGPRAGYLDGNLWINPRSESYGEGVVFNMPSQGTWGGLRWYRNSSPFTGNWAFGYFGNEFNNDIGFHNGTNGWRLDHSFNNTVNGSFRAPIFYDSNNTGYYLDPNSTSNLVGLTVFNPISGFVTGCTFAEDSVNKDDITTRTDSGFYQSSSGTTAEGWPVNSGSWQHMISCTHSNDGNYFAMQLGSTFFDQGLFYRVTGGSGSTGWSRVALYGNGYAAPLYANVYYDADNTTYYLDPSTTGTSLNVAGAIVAGGNVTAYSDIRIKANVETISSALDKLGQIRGVTYTRTDLEDKEQRYAGVIAQEIEAVLPEAVRDLGNIKAVDYNATIGLLIEAVKELTNKVKALEAKEQ